MCHLHDLITAQRPHSQYHHIEDWVSMYEFGEDINYSVYSNPHIPFDTVSTSPACNMSGESLPHLCSSLPENKYVHLVDIMWNFFSELGMWGCPRKSGWDKRSPKSQGPFTLVSPTYWNRDHGCQRFHETIKDTLS